MLPTGKARPAPGRKERPLSTDSGGAQPSASNLFSNACCVCAAHWSDHAPPSCVENIFIYHRGIGSRPAPDRTGGCSHYAALRKYWEIPAWRRAIASTSPLSASLSSVGACRRQQLQTAKGSDRIRCDQRLSHQGNDSIHYVAFQRRLDRRRRPRQHPW